MTNIERGRPAEAVHEQARNLNQQMERRAEHDAIDQTINAEARHKKDRADDLTDVVHAGRERGQNKMLVGLQRRHHQTADRKDDRADQVEAHEFCEKFALFFAEAGRNAEVGIHDLLRKDGNDDGESARYQKTHVCHAREQVPCGGAIFGGEIFRQQRDERHCQRAAGDERKQQVGQIVGGVERVEHVDFV